MTHNPPRRTRRRARGLRFLAARSVDVERIQIQQHGVGGLLWIAAWLFTIGFLRLTFWKAVLALLLWPYYLGSTLASMPR